ncbi:DUF3422 domain-containing protein [Variovorax paradoxus]|nr:DUF3422 domain-containing protein [Variovorax paradoxus]
MGCCRDFACKLLREQQGGRLLQRLYEVETYRMMALIALPMAREAQKKLVDIERALAQHMQRPEIGLDAQQDEAQLEMLTRLAMRVEALSALVGRFSATQAYEKLVLARIHELREERIEGVPTIAEFMERRFVPAMDTCRSARQRQEELATRIARAVDLLRTRVTLAQERDVTRLLAEMERTAGMQLRLQHSIEGLSVAAISYYVLALLVYAMKSLKAVHVPMNVELAAGALVLPIVFGVIRMMRRLRTGNDSTQH